MLQALPLGERPRELLAGALESREHAGATIVQDSIAMPHCRSILVDDFAIVLGRAPKGIGWPDKKINLIILFISPVKPSGPQEHMDLIRHLVKSIKGKKGREKLSKVDTPGEMARHFGFELIEGESDETGS
jgi:mannitol/fructose-specific phosphotransferase system IIA component (Ntr-type)